MAELGVCLGVGVATIGTMASGWLRVRSWEALLRIAPRRTQRPFPSLARLRHTLRLILQHHSACLG